MRVSNTNSIRLMTLGICNLILLIIELYFIENINVQVVNSSSGVYYSATLNIVMLLLNTLLPAIHVVASFILLPNIFLSLLNRLFFVIYTVSLGCEEAGTGAFFGEATGLVLSLLIIVALKRVVTLPSAFFQVDFKKVVKGYTVRRVNMDKIALLIASHIVGALSIFVTLLYTHIASYLEAYVLGANHVLIPLLLLSLGILASGELLSSTDYIVVGFTSGLGVIGLVPLLSTIAIKRMISATYSSRVIYTDKRGLYIGEARAILTYGRPSTVYRELGKRTRTFDEKETWYWREITHSLYVSFEELNTPHIIIVGSSGSGKTTLAKHIVTEANKLYGYNVVIIDQHGEYGDLASLLGCKVVDASKCSLNPLVLENTSPRERALQLAHVVSTIFKLGFLQRRMLEEVIMKAYELKGLLQSDPNTWRKSPPTLQDLVETCRGLGKEIPEFNRLLPYLVLLNEHMSGGMWLSIEELLLENTIIDMSNLSSDFARALFMDTLMYMMISKMYSIKSSRKIMVVVEEARGMLPRSLTRELLSRLFTESRKFGFSIVVISQEIRRIPKALVENAGLRIFFVLNEPRSIEEASRIIGGSDMREKALAVTEALRTLSPHMFIIHATGVNTVFIAKSPFLEKTREKHLPKSD